MRYASSISAALLLSSALLTREAHADGVYGRLDGDIGLAVEAGVSEALGEDVAGESIAVRGGVFFLQTVGVTVQYNDALGIDALPLQRSVAGSVELRPLFLGRWAQNMEQGPAHLDLLIDSLGIGMGVFGAWPRDGGTTHGMELSLGVLLPLLPRASTPFIAFRGALRWSLEQPPADAGRETAPLSGLLTLTIGYQHLFEVHLVDAGDQLGD
jgi:hypothetical protein